MTHPCHAHFLLFSGGRLTIFLDSALCIVKVCQNSSTIRFSASPHLRISASPHLHLDFIYELGILWPWYLGYPGSNPIVKRLPCFQNWNDNFQNIILESVISKKNHNRRFTSRIDRPSLGYYRCNFIYY